MFVVIIVYQYADSSNFTYVATALLQKGCIDDVESLEFGKYSTAYTEIQIVLAEKTSTPFVDGTMQYEMIQVLMQRSITSVLYKSSVVIS